MYPANSESGNRHTAVNRMVREITAVLADCSPSVYLYGSAVLNDFRLGWSDIDILVLTEKTIPEEPAEKLVSLRQRIREKDPGNLYYRMFEGGMLTLNAFLTGSPDRVVYWGTGGERITDRYIPDSFCITTLIDSGALLYGSEIRHRLCRPGFNALYTDIQHHYETIRKYARNPGRSIYSFGWILDIARCLYTLRTGRIIAKTAAGVWALENQLCPDPGILETVLRIRRNPPEPGDTAVFDLAERMGEPIQRFADILERELNKLSKR